MTLLTLSDPYGPTGSQSHPATGTYSTPLESASTEDMSPELHDTSFMAKAACLGLTDLFYSPHVCWTDCPDDCQAGRSEVGRFERIKKAKAVCAKCPVEEECLEWALETRFPFAVIGGKTERERKLLLKSRGTTGAPLA